MDNGNKKIRVGIDAKWYFGGPPSGHMVIKNLVNELLKSHTGYELFLIMNRRHKKLARFLFPPDVKAIYLPPIPNMLSNMLLVPLVAMRYKMDVVLFQNFCSFWPDKIFKVAYIHDMLFLDYPQYYSKTEVFHFKFMKYMAAKAGLVITISQTERKRMLEHQVAPAENIAVVYHGISCNFKPACSYAPHELGAARFAYNLPERYLLFVGRVNIRKNLGNLVRAMNMLNDEKIKLLIVGEAGNLNGALAELIDAENVHDRIQFTGYIPERDLYKVYACATVFCFPSFAEGFGLPPLEAMRCGVPSIVTDRTAMPEVCGDAAVYVDPDDLADIALKINLLLDNKLYYMQKSAAGIDQAARYSWERSAKQILNFIKNAYVYRETHTQA